MNETKEWVSVVLPVFNTEKYIVECLSALKNQTYKYIDLFIVDDGSTDNTRAVIDDFINKFGIKNWVVISTSNEGVSNARNIALDQIDRSKKKYKYIYFSDSDDFISKDAIEYAVYAIKKYKSESCYFNIVRFNKENFREAYTRSEMEKKQHLNYIVLEGDEIITQYLKLEKKWKHHPSSDCFLNNKLFLIDIINGLRFDCQLKRSNDFDFFLRLLPEVKKVVIINKGTYFYRLRKSSISSRVALYGDFTACQKCFANSERYSEKQLSGILTRMIRAVYLDAEYYIINEEFDKFEEEREVINRIIGNYLKITKYDKYLYIIKAPRLFVEIYFKVRHFFKKNKLLSEKYYE